MKVSIAMTTYNGIRFLEPQLRSLVEQTRHPDEIIICDDGSTDGTVQYVEKFLLDYPQIEWTVKVNPENLGWQANFMQAFSLTTGDIILCADQDDVWHPEKIARMCAVLEENPQCELLGCDYTLIDASGAPAGKKRVLYPPKKGKTLEKVPFSPIFYEAVRPGCALAFRRELLQIAEPYWVEKYPHDELLWNFAILRSTACLLHEPLLHYRVHGGNTTTHKNTKEERMAMLEFQQRACEQCLRYVQQHEPCKNHMGIVQKGIDFFKIRKCAMEGHSVFWMLMLLYYIPYYTYKPAYFKDWKYRAW